MSVPPLETETIVAHYDEAKKLIFIAYYGVLTSEVSLQAYQWMHKQLSQGLKDLQGAVFDFQQVYKFDNANMEAVQKLSRELNEKFDLSSIPAALVVSDSAQEQMMQETVRRSPQPERKCVVRNIEDGIEFMRQFRQTMILREYKIVPLETNNVTCRYDEEARIAHVIYYGLLSPDVTEAVYGWLANAAQVLNADMIRGGVFDFRRVSRFDRSNLDKVESASAALNTRYNMSRIPTALIVRDYYQEQMMRLSLRITPQEKRKKLVRSMEQALQFIEEFSQ